MPSRNTIEIVIQGEDRASNVLSKISGTLTTIGKVGFAAVATGAAAAVGAIAGFATASLVEFTKFEKGVSEVFTLIPDASEEMKKKLIDDIQQINQRFGLLNNETVPAFYQAISAGVPSDNVLEFMQVASKAAIGGVTTLETAVDGITSVVNAYGREVLSAENASDLLFTAVRLGKTDFTQLSASLFNVVPTAASLGVGLDQVSAALAVLTAQGTPTSVATTQLRQLFVELSKAGTDLSTNFEQIAGKSFIQFTKEGGNVTEALEMIRKQVGDDAFRNMFGSVEALNAALGITGPNAEKFASALGEMANSAGATDKAFETMSKTISFQINQIRAKLEVLRTEVGSRIAPSVVAPLEAISETLSVIIALVKDGFGGIENTDFGRFGNVVAQVLTNINDLQMGLRNTARRIQYIFKTDIIGAFKDGLNITEKIGIGTFNILNLLGLNQNVSAKIATALQNQILQPFQKIFKSSSRLGRETSVLFQNLFSNIDLSNIDFGSIIGNIFKVASLTTPAGIIRTALLEVFDIDILGAIQKIIDGVADFIQFINLGVDPLKALGLTIKENLGDDAFNVFKTIVDTISSVGQTIQPVIEAIKTFIETIGMGADPILSLGVLITKIFGLDAGIAFTDFATKAKDFIINTFNNIVSFVQTQVIPRIQEFIGVLIRIWEAVRPGLEAIGNWFLTEILPRVVDFITNTVIPSIQDFLRILGEAWEGIRPSLEKLGEWFIDTVIPAIVDILENVLLPVISELIDILTTIWTNVQPYLTELADWFLTTALPAIVAFITDVVIAKVNELIERFKAIWTDAQPFLNDLKTGIQTIFDFIKNNIIQPVIDAINSIPETFNRVKSEVERIAGEVGVFFDNLNPFSGSGFLAQSPLGYANGMDYFPRAQTVRVHRGEAVLTAEENAARLNGNTNNTNTFQIIINAPMTREQANDTTNNMVDALRQKGIDL